MQETIDTIHAVHEGRRKQPRFFNMEILALAIAALSAIVLIGTAVSPDVNVVTMIVAGLAFTLSLTLAIRLLMDPDSVRARQSDAML